MVTCLSCGAEHRTAPPHQSVASEAPLQRISAPAAPAAPLAAVAPPPPTVDERVFDVPPGHCPKCISRRSPKDEACPTCGMVFANALDTFSPGEWLRAEWLKLLAQWADEPAHQALQLEALRGGQLAELGRLYRLRLAAQPGDLPAQRGRDEVLRLAVLPQVSTLKPKSDGEPTWKVVMLTAVILMCLLALFLLVRQMLTLS